jgi:DNA-binding NarL/FixJ family response regulator
MIQVLIVEDVPLFGCGIRATLERTGECLVFDFTELTKIAELTRQQQPDVAIISGELIGVDPCFTVHLLRKQAPAIGIIILALSQDEELLFQFVKVGASAYELRTITPEALIDRVRRVSRGEYLITDEVLLPFPKLDLLLPPQMGWGGQQENGTPAPATKSPLSSRELEILGYVAGGNGNKAIANILKISDQTVKNHITSIFKKLQIGDRTAAVMCALRHGWIKLEAIGIMNNGSKWLK